VALSTLVALMSTAAGVFEMIVSQAIGAVLVDMYFLEPFLALSRRKWWRFRRGWNFWQTRH